MLVRPERLVGIHFFNPVAMMPLVEVVEAKGADPAAVQAACAFVRQIDKLPLPVKSAPGFLVNAVLAPYMLAAMHAVTRMHQAIEQLGEGELHLKIGVHSGSCIAVELNERLDYFGRTVNIAARVQGIAGAGEIVCTQAVYDKSGVREVVEAAGFSAEVGSVALRGISGDTTVVRLRRRPA